MTNRADIAETANIQVREEAGVIMAAGFHQGYINAPFAVFGQIAGGSGPASTAADHNDLGLAMACGPKGRRLQCGQGRGARANKGASVQCHSSSSHLWAGLV